MTTPVELIIFDCDGVLVDSEPISNRVFATMLNELGIPVTLDEMFESFVGKPMAECLELAAHRFGRDIPDGFEREFRIRSKVALEAELKAVPGIELALGAIDLPYCAASNGSIGKMRMTLGMTGLFARFQGRLFSASDVARAKPAPDVFLHAAEKSGATPSACLVIEDTPIGVRAGIAAGMRVFGYCARIPAQRLIEAGAHRTFSDMAALPALLSGGEYAIELSDSPGLPTQADDSNHLHRKIRQ